MTKRMWLDTIYTVIAISMAILNPLGVVWGINSFNWLFWLIEAALASVAMYCGLGLYVDVVQRLNPDIKVKFKSTEK